MRPFHPIHWVPTPTLDQNTHTELTSLQYSPSDYGDLYRDRGLLYLSKIDRVHYLKIVDAIADRIHKAAAATPLAQLHPMPQLRDIMPTFPRRGSAQLESSESPDFDTPTVTKGPKFAQFVFVASEPTSLKQVRQDVTAYGTVGGDEWNPFPSATDESIAIIAMEAALQAKLQYEQLHFIDDPNQFRLTVENAMLAGKPLVIIMDIWTLCLDRYHKVLRNLDGITYLHCTAILPWNLSDRETASNLSKLTDALTRTFPVKCHDERHSIYLKQITNLDSLRSQLLEILTQTKNRIILTLEPQRSVPKAGFIVDLPIISAPTASG